MVKNKSIYILVPLLIFNTLWLLPRFNLNNFLNTNYKTIELADQNAYIQNTEFFRGKVDKPAEIFIYRPLVPWLASKFPFEAMTSINILNLLFSLFTTIILWHILSSLNFGSIQKTMLILAYLISFPVFYYSTIGYIDSAYVFILAIGYWLTKNPDRIYLAFWALIAPWVNEKAIILLGSLALNSVFKQENKSIFNRNTLTPLALLFLFLFSHLTIRFIFGSENPGYIWKIEMSHIEFNFTRAKSWISALLSFGVVGFLSSKIFFVNFNQKLNYRSFFSNLDNNLLLVSFMLWVYSVFAAHMDGRFLWPFHFFSVIYIAKNIEVLNFIPKWMAFKKES